MNKKITGQMTERTKIFFQWNTRVHICSGLTLLFCRQHNGHGISVLHLECIVQKRLNRMTTEKKINAKRK